MLAVALKLMGTAEGAAIVDAAVRGWTSRASSLGRGESALVARNLYTLYRGFGFPSLQSSFGTRPTGRSAVRPRRTMAFGRLQELLPGHL